MIIRDITIEEWKYFHKSYPYHQFEGWRRNFEEDCVEHCKPNSSIPVKGAFLDNTLAGLISYNTMYFRVDKKNDNEVKYMSRNLLPKQEEHTTPVIYVYTMVVHPDFRRKKVSSSFMDFLEKNKSIEEYILMYPVSDDCVHFSKANGFIYDDHIWLNQDDMAKKL